MANLTTEQREAKKKAEEEKVASEETKLVKDVKIEEEKKPMEEKSGTEAKATNDMKIEVAVPVQETPQASSLDFNAIFDAMEKDPDLKGKFAAMFPQTNVQNIVMKRAEDEMMTVRHMIQCAKGISTPITYGSGKIKKFYNFGETFDISVKEFEQEFAPTPLVRALLQQRILIVGENCPEEVRKRLELNYQEGEFLTEDQLKNLLLIPTKELCEIFESLCMSQKEIVLGAIANDVENGARNITREKVEEINKVSKKFVDSGKKGMLAPVLERLNVEATDEY